MMILRVVFIMVFSLISQLVYPASFSGEVIGSSRENQCNDIATKGEKVLCFIKFDYNSDPSRCDQDDNKPGFMCSGIIIRGTTSDLNRDYYSWNPSPASVESGGVSFSFLRKDSRFKKLAYDYVNGLIFYPADFTPQGKDSTIKVLCGFPLDAGTDKRSDSGCNRYSNIEMSKLCILQDIYTASQWFDNNYMKSGGNLYHYCGFVLYSADNSINTSQQFDAMIKAQILLKDIAFNMQNEFRLATWEQNKIDIPLEAFFYISASSSGLTSAQLDQQTFFIHYNEFIPIIEVSLPAVEGLDAEFHYNLQDQKITPQ